MRNGQKPRKANVLIDEAFALLRARPGLLLPYFAGTLPFFLGFLFFWFEMSQKTVGSDRLAASSFFLAAGFLWMKTWQAVYCQDILAALANAPLPRLTFSRFFRLLGAQGLLQGLGIFLLPVSLFFLFPFGWVYAFFNSALAWDTGFRKLWKRAWHQALLWPVSNHAMLFWLGLMSLAVLINVVTFCFMVPYMAKIFLGYDSLFVMSGRWVLNTTFLAFAGCLAYLCMDPIVKASYSLRCFYAESRTSGKDLLARWQSALPLGLLAGILVFFLQAPPCQAQASLPVNDSPSPAIAVQSNLPDKLDRSLDRVLETAPFAWRRPAQKIKEKEEENFPGFIRTAFQWMAKQTKALIRAVARWVRSFFKWWRGLFPEPEPGNFSPSAGWKDAFLGVLLLVAAVLACLAVVYGLRFWRNRKKKEKDDPAFVEALAKVPDLNDESVLAHDLPANQWRELARNLAREGRNREAVRALFLGLLAHLSRAGLVFIARFKSNQDYREELYRKASDLPALTECFSQGVGMFDRFWYGSYSVHPKDLEWFFQKEQWMSEQVDSDTSTGAWT